MNFKHSNLNTSMGNGDITALLWPHIQYTRRVSSRAGRKETCVYCGETFDIEKEGHLHFIPCHWCDSLEHATCQH